MFLVIFKFNNLTIYISSLKSRIVRAYKELRQWGCIDAVFLVCCGWVSNVKRINDFSEHSEQLKLSRITET